MLIGRHPTDRKKWCVYAKMERKLSPTTGCLRFEKYTYVECRLETGRTTTIRVHISIHHPLLGDTVYYPANVQ